MPRNLYAWFFCAWSNSFHDISSKPFIPIVYIALFCYAIWSSCRSLRKSGTSSLFHQHSHTSCLTFSQRKSIRKVKALHHSTTNSTQKILNSKEQSNLWAKRAKERGHLEFPMIPLPKHLTVGCVFEINDTATYWIRGCHSAHTNVFIFIYFIKV